MVTNYYQGNGEALQPKTLSTRIFKFLKRYVDRLLPQEKMVILTFNEFSFREFVPMTAGGYNGGEKLPSHLIVPCIRFVVSRKFHLLGSLFFHVDYLRDNPDKFSKDISECIKLYILALENINLKVIATVCPLSGLFHHAIEILTQIRYVEEYDGVLSYSVGKNKDIIHIHDPKYIRDGFIRWFMFFNLEFSLNGNYFEASRGDILDVLELNNKPPLLQKSNNNNRYYHQISIYYFNEQISVNIRRLIKQGYLSSHAIGTSLFINMFRQLFHKIYGLNDEICEMFDLERINEYIEFIKSIRAVPSPFRSEEDFKQGYASSVDYSKKTKSNKELNALERFVKETPATYSGLYTEVEKSLDSLQREDMYEPIMITTSSGKTFVPCEAPSTTKTSKSKNKKKSKKERRKQRKNLELQQSETNEKSKIEDSKKDLLLVYNNPNKNSSDNGEFLLCTPKKYEEMQLSTSSKISKRSPEKKELCSGKNNEEKQSNSSKEVESCESLESRPVHVKIDSPSDKRKILSPVQNIPEEVKDGCILSRSSDVSNSNLNENIRKYSNVNKNNLGANNKKCDKEESNKENAIQSYIINIPEIEEIDSTTAEKMNLLDDEIKEISYTISDPEDSTEYQFEQSYSLDNRKNKVTIQGENSRNAADFSNEGLVNKETMNELLKKYLSKEQLKELMASGAGEGGGNANEPPKFDDFIKYLKARNTQYVAILNEMNNKEETPQNTNEIEYETIETTDEEEEDDFEETQEPTRREEVTAFEFFADLPYIPVNRPITESEQEGNLTCEFKSFGKKSGSYDLLKASENKNRPKKFERITTLDFSDSTSTESSPSTSPREFLAKFREDCKDRVEKSKFNLDEPPYEDPSIIQRISVLPPSSKNRNSGLSTSECSSSGFMNNEALGGKKEPLLEIPRLFNPRKSTNLEKEKKEGSSESEEDIKIINRMRKVKEESGNNEISDKFSDFNSEYDEFDDMLLNKHVKMIINKLEEKDEEIVKVMNKLEIEKNAPPAKTKESNTKRGFVKKEIYPQGQSSKTGAIKRTIFHRDKTEESGAAPSNVIKNSESSSCDKAKIASTRASYSETLGVKTKKQMAKVRQEQYKKVANTISQTIKRFSNIFNLPDSEEEKSVRISKASLDFVYDLKKVNDVPDIRQKQELLDDAYDKLCLSILGEKAENSRAQDKMKELMPLLQEIASPNYKNKNPDTSDSILSKHINKTISSSSTMKKEKKKKGENVKNKQDDTSRYVREDVQNLWVNNVRGIERLFKRLGAEKFYYELSPELFKTDHVEHMMNYIQVNGPKVEAFPLDERCLPIDLPECFDTLKPHGSTILLDE